MTNYIERYWRDATPQDSIAEPPMVARFRDHEDYLWLVDYLTGIRCNHDYPWYSKRLGSRKHCQVYDAPDPGEGWRLIDPDEPIYLQDGIEYWFPAGKRWEARKLAGSDKEPFTTSHVVYYRIRIEQPKPEPKYEPFRWEDREQLRGRWIVDSDGDEHCIVRLELHQEVFFINGASAEDALGEWTFLDTGEPVGRKVE